MENKKTINEKEVQQVAAAIYADLKANDVKAGNMDEMFEAVKRYAAVTREQFDEYFKQLNESRELDEAELDMVAGGSFKDFMCSPWGIVTIIAASVVLGVCLGAASFGVAALLSAGTTAGATVGTAAATAATAGAIGASTVGEAAFAGGFFGFFGGVGVAGITNLALGNN